MSGLFYGLEIAKTGLSVSQQGISLAGHNISNANTEGYTRQRIIQNSIDPSTAHTRISLVSKSSIGGGVEITLIDQIRSDYLDKQYRTENATLGNYSTRAEELDYIETIMNELSDSGISEAMADFFDSISELAADPVNDEIRTSVQQNALKMIESFNYYYNTLTDLQSTYNENMDVTVTQINDLLTSIASYNDQVYSYELSGEQANDLRDKRNLLLDELSGLINITYSEGTDGTLTVQCDGVDLVSHTDYATLYTNAEVTEPISGVTDFYEIYIDPIDTSAADAVFSYSDGALMAYKNLRDGSTSSDIGIPYILNRLNTLARSIAEEYNDIHTTGYTQPTDTTTSQTGINFFEVPSGGYSDITAGNFALSSDVLDSVRNIAASAVTVTDTEAGNNEIALALVELSSKTDIATVGSFEEYLNSTAVEIGIESSTAQTLYSSQQSIVDTLDERKESISGVSLDEEMVTLMTYQHAYTAAARVLTALDEALEVLINRTGTVGL